MKFTELLSAYSSRQALWEHLFEYNEHGFFVWKVTLSARGLKGSVAGAWAGHYFKVGVAGKDFYIHRIIYEMRNGDTEFDVDHIDRDRLNNVHTNLRPATHAENCRNVGAHKDNALGVKGVSFDKRRNKYETSIIVSKKRFFLGRFDTPEEASEVYQAAVKELHGEFANAS